MKLKGYLKSQKGVTPTGTIITIMIMSLLVLLGIVIGKPFMHSLTFNSEVEAIVKVSLKKNNTVITKNVMRALRERDFELFENGLTITRDFDDDSLSVKVEYYYELELPYYERTLEFETVSSNAL